MKHNYSNENNSIFLKKSIKTFIKLKYYFKLMKIAKVSMKKTVYESQILKYKC